MKTETDTKTLETQLRDWSSAVAAYLNCEEKDGEPVDTKEYRRSVGVLLPLLDVAHERIVKEYVSVEGLPEHKNPMWPLACAYLLGSFVYNRSSKQYREEAEKKAA